MCELQLLLSPKTTWKEFGISWPRRMKTIGDVLWWAELDAKEQEQLAALGGMTVNERLFHLGLMTDFDAAVVRGESDTVKVTASSLQTK